MKLCFNFKNINKNNYIKFITKKNFSMAEKFKAFPFSQRIVLLPHCMRNTKQCKAVDEGTYILYDTETHEAKTIQDYVIPGLDIDENGFGDYVVLTID